MKQILLIIVLSAIILFAWFGNLQSKNAPGVFVFADINIDSGDTGDRQSLIHFLCYVDELKIKEVVPGHWNATALKHVNWLLRRIQKTTLVTLQSWRERLS